MQNKGQKRDLSYNVPNEKNQLGEIKNIILKFQKTNIFYSVSGEQDDVRSLKINKQFPAKKPFN